MIGLNGETDESGELQLTWDILGYELKQPRHSFTGLSVNTKNTVEFVSDSGPLVPRDRIIHKVSTWMGDHLGDHLEGVG